MRKPKVLSLLLAAVLLLGCTGCTPVLNSAATLSQTQSQPEESVSEEAQPQSDVLLYQDDLRGVWISYIELESMMQDHTSRTFLTIPGWC